MRRSNRHVDPRYGEIRVADGGRDARDRERGGTLAAGRCAIVEPRLRDADCESGSAGTTVQIPTAVEGKFNVAMVLIGPHDDSGWSQAHYEGLQYLCSAIPGTHIAYVELVPDTDTAAAEQVFRTLARDGFDLIIGTSFGYMDPMETVAADFPDQTFVHLTGYKSNFTNYGNLFGAMEDMKYLAGMLAGSRAKLDGNPKLGYMATFGIPEELRLGNAIMLGAKQTCPECTMDIRFIGTWHDVAKEHDGAASLFAAGADVVFTGADTPANAQAAEEAGKWAVTYDHPDSCKSDKCLTAPYWIWGPEYAKIAQAVKDGTYKPGFDYFDADSGAMGLYGFMDGQDLQPGVKDLPAADVQLVKDTLAKMLAGTFNRFDVFTGPVSDNHGAVIIPAGSKLVQADLDQFPPGAPTNPCPICMHWLAAGINGEIPAQ